jgi:hypothetical protein
MAFSDTNSSSQFGYIKSGLNYTFSLHPGTLFSSALGGSMAFSARVAPGVVNDPDVFWGGKPSGSVDLFNLTISSGPSRDITPVLKFGSSTAGFALDYRDSSGNPIAPSNPASVAGIESQIKSAFVGGALTTDLTDLFTVGFVPSGSVSEYTLGKQDSSMLPAVEPLSVPEPAPLTLTALGALAYAAVASRRRRNRKRGRDRKRGFIRLKRTWPRGSPGS